MSEHPVLLIPDIHQDSGFLERCLELGRAEEVSEIVFLGDLVDSKSPLARRPESIRKILEISQDLIDRQNPSTTLLWGNHDWMYWSQRILLKVLGEENPKGLQEISSIGLDPNTARILTEERSADGRNRIFLWEKARLAVSRYGWLITHAGVHESLWPVDQKLEDGVTILNRRMEGLAEDPTTTDDHPLLGAGPVRGGFHEVGGPLWQDFNAEFEDSLPFPQIVGHTRCAEVMRKGRSYCLDVCQQACALLHPNGEIQVRSVAG